MKRHVFIVIIWIVSASFGYAEGEKKSQEIKPLLSDSFGEIIEIEGKMVDARYTRRKAHAGRTVISITHVGKQQLKEPVVMDVRYFRYFRYSNFKPPVRGKLVKFRGYESGGFTGIPNKAFKDIPRVSTTTFWFVSHFVVTRSLQPKQEPADDGPLPGPPPVPKDGKILPDGSE